MRAILCVAFWGSRTLHKGKRMPNFGRRHRRLLTPEVLIWLAGVQWMPKPLTSQQISAVTHLFSLPLGMVNRMRVWV